MDHISDPILFKAVMFARKMMRQGVPPSVANARAASFYDVAVSSLAHYTGQVAARCARRKRENSGDGSAYGG